MPRVDRSSPSYEPTEAQSDLFAGVDARGVVEQLPAIAEGVETQLQLQELRSLDCELGQGFYFHRPLAAEQISLLLAS